VFFPEHCVDKFFSIAGENTQEGRKEEAAETEANED